MKDFLLKETGEINEEWIDDYLSSHDINGTFDNTRHSLLHAVVSSEEIRPDKKLELASYLLSKGALVNYRLGIKGVMLKMARNQNNLELVNLLLKEEIKHKFDEFGLIRSDDVALILAAKMSKKPYKNTIFVINNPDLPLLAEQIKGLIEKDTDINTIKFQIIYFHQNHAIFGEFEIDKTNVPPVVKYFHCDPAAELTEYSEIISLDFIEKITPLANIEIYDSAVCLQKTKGCSYFSIDGAMMLAVPEDRPYFTNVMEHMEKNSDKIERSEDEKLKYIKSHSFPARLIRGLQYDGKEHTHKEPNLHSFFNTEEKNTVVNKAGETAENAMEKDLKKVPSRVNSEDLRTFNYRAERKMKQYGEAVVEFIEDKNILEPDFAELVEQYKIKGLVQFCEERIGHENDQNKAFN